MHPCSKLTDIKLYHAVYSTRMLKVQNNYLKHKMYNLLGFKEYLMLQDDKNI